MKKQINFLHFWESEVSPSGLKSRSEQGQFLLEAPRRKSVLACSHFQGPPAVLGLGPLLASSEPAARHPSWPLTVAILAVLLTVPRPSLSYVDLCDHTWETQDHPLTSRLLMTSARILLPLGGNVVTSAQILGLRIWRLWGAVFVAPPKLVPSLGVAGCCAHTPQLLNHRWFVPGTWALKHHSVLSSLIHVCMPTLLAKL